MPTRSTPATSRTCSTCATTWSMVASAWARSWLHVAVNAANARWSVGLTPTSARRRGGLRAPARGLGGDELRHERDHAHATPCRAASPARRRARCAVMSQTARAEECENITGTSLTRRASRMVSADDVGEVDEHADPVHLAHHLARRTARARRAPARPWPSRPRRRCRCGSGSGSGRRARAAAAAWPGSSRSSGRPRRPSARRSVPRRTPPRRSSRGPREAQLVGVPGGHLVHRVDLLERGDDGRVAGAAVRAPTPTRTAPPTPPSRSRGRSVCVVVEAGGQVEPVEVVAGLRARLPRQVVVAVDEGAAAQQLGHAGEGRGGVGHAAIQPHANYSEAMTAATTPLAVLPAASPS